MASARHVSRIEVESKFTPTPLLRYLFGDENPSKSTKRHSRMVQSGLAHLVLRRQRSLKVRDTYLDVDDKLSFNGIWVRRRETHMLPRRDESYVASQPDVQWEAKIKLGGSFNNSSFEEISGRDTVTALIQERCDLALEDLQVTADLSSIRSIASLHDSIVEKESPETNTTLVVDTVTEHDADNPGMQDFVHEVGEVELVKELSSATEDDKKQVSKRMREILDEFMLRRAEFFSKEVTPVGKLSAYFAWKQGQAERNQA